jgi:hypothetical protein
VFNTMHLEVAHVVQRERVARAMERRAARAHRQRLRLVVGREARAGERLILALSRARS